MTDINGSVDAVESISGELLDIAELEGLLQEIFEIEGHNPLPLLYGGLVVKSARIADGRLIMTLADGTEIDVGEAGGGEPGPAGPPGADAPIDYAYSDAEIDTLIF